MTKKERAARIEQAKQHLFARLQQPFRLMEVDAKREDAKRLRKQLRRVK